MPTTQGPRTWHDVYAHQYQEGLTKDGYMVCMKCGKHQNEPEIVKLCPESSLAELIDMIVDAVWREGARHDRYCVCCEQLVTPVRPCGCGEAYLKVACLLTKTELRTAVERAVKEVMG